MSPALSRRFSRRPRFTAAVVVLLVAGVLLAFQPLRSPWWSGYDFDSVYVGSALTLFRGEASLYYDHPGAPLQEALAATFTASWVLSSPGQSRSARADEWLENLDRTRPYFRVWASLLYLVSALIAFVAVAWVTRSAGWGLFGGLLFLASPEVITWAAVVKPDPLLAALSIAMVALTVEGYRRREPGLYLAAAAVLGYAVSVKVHAIGLVVPLALAALLRPPPDGWWTTFRNNLREWLREHRHLAGAVVGAWLVLVLALNVGAAAPSLKPLVQLLSGLFVLAAVCTGLWRLVRRTRVAAVVALAIGCGWVGIAGMIVPSLLYASFPPVMARETAITLTGGGPNVGARPAVAPWEVLGPWQWMLVFALIGLVKGVLSGDRTALLWASAAVAMGSLAYLRYGHVHYYTAAVALTIPLVLAGIAAVIRHPGVLATVVVAAVLYSPYTTEIDKARGRSREAENTEKVNRWVEPRLRRGEVALTQLESSDGRYFHLVRYYAPQAPELDYKFLPPDDQGARWVREHRVRVRYVITGGEVEVDELLSSIGLSGRGRRVTEAPGFVYAVRQP